MSIKCTRYKSVNKGVLQGFCDLLMPLNEQGTYGFVIKDCSVCMKDDKRWINFPSKKYESQTGESKYQNYVFFCDGDGKYHKGFKDSFDKKALVAIEQYCKEQQNSPEQMQYKSQEEPDPQEELPF